MDFGLTKRHADGALVSTLPTERRNLTAWWWPRGGGPPLNWSERLKARVPVAR